MEAVAEAEAEAGAKARARAGAEPCGRPKKAFGMCQLALADVEAVTAVDATGLSVVCPLPFSTCVCVCCGSVSVFAPMC